VQILVEDHVVPIDITQGDQHQPHFLRRSERQDPAIAYHAARDGGPLLTIFESGAVMQYLAEKEGRFLPTELRSRNETVQQHLGAGTIELALWVKRSRRDRPL
jgi:GSH-dependent disulfide-bond oxidoreductase